MEVEKEQKEPEKRLPCENCGEPMVDKITLSGKKIVACSKYPHCYPDNSYSDEDSWSC